MNEQDAHAYHWVVLPEAERWIGEVTRHGASATRIAHLRRELSPAQVREVIEQARLRDRARKKFRFADRMFFTEKGLQQATGQRLGAYKAADFPVGKLADLCCGIGGDLLSLAERHEVVALDNDSEAATFAEANCRALGRSSAEVRIADASQIALEQFAAWHIDPDRRPHGRRTTRTEYSQPSADAIERMLRRNRNAGIKLAPAANVPVAWKSEAELEWIGIDRECRQLFARFGSLARNPGKRAATILDSAGRVACRVVDQPEGAFAQPPLARSLGKLLCEPHACVIAAGLVAALAEQHGLSAVAPKVAYLTADEIEPNPALAIFEVDACLPFDVRKVKAALRVRCWGRLEIKRRGVPSRTGALDPKLLRKRLRVDGDEAGVLLLMPWREHVVAVLARRR